MRKLGALAICLVTVSLFAEVKFLPQNWTDADRQWVYTTPQGSKLLPYTWAMSLERANEAKLWSEELTRFGFFANPSAPDGLPVGVLRDGDHFGFTCASCHTGQVNYRGTTWQIDGGPTHSDQWALMTDLAAAMQAAAASPSGAKFRGFAKRVLGDGDTPAARAKLYQELRTFNTYFQKFVAGSRATVAHWGPARTDAFGMIFNRVTGIDLNVPSNIQPPNAPVSYPFLWQTSWFDRVQWNGIAKNSFALERLARNVGEVMGVFAEVEITKPKFLHWYYPSTARRINLLHIEDRMSDLRAPRWIDANFPAINQQLAATGQPLYVRHCQSCHAPVTPGRHQKVTMTPIDCTAANPVCVQTDPAMAVDSARRMSSPGVLRGTREFFLFGDRFGSSTATTKLLTNAVLGAMLSPVDLHDETNAPPQRAANDSQDADRARVRAHLEALPKERNGQPRAHPDLEVTLKAFAARTEEARKSGEALAYKARPLDGIWATAPYLHNGSVPTLYDLLLPAAQRPATFHVGNWEFDPAKVGFETTPVKGSFLFDTRVRGNRNGGHEWGTTLSEPERLALLEYLKTL